MEALVVLSHPEPSSFCAALARCAAQALGTDVLDLYGEGFDPRLGPGDFTERAVSERLEPMVEQLHASRSGTYEPVLACHIERFRACDLLVLVQPLWWFGLPAMAKGWVDRVFANGVAYRYPGVVPWTGPLGGKRALVVFTTANEERDFRPERAGTVRSVLLPLLHGTLAYTGMRVLEPFMAYAADSVDEPTRAGYLAALGARLGGIADEPPIDPLGEAPARG